MTSPSLKLLRQAQRTRAAFERALTVELDAGTLADLRAAGAVRGIRAETLARRIVENVCDEGLIDAILDDADEIERISDAREAHRARAHGFARAPA